MYINLKNDISFILGSYMHLWEHQSTINLNMPLRGLQYFSNLFTNYIATSKQNIYGRQMVKIPTPKYYVFYNGTADQEDVKKLRLSDMFIKKDDSKEFEWTATVININYRNNIELLSRCVPLREYSFFVELIRNYSKECSINEAVNKAMAYVNNHKEEFVCIRNFLNKNRNEVSNMLINEFNQEEYEKGLYEDGKREGKEEGLEEGMQKGKREGLEEGMQKGVKKQALKTARKMLDKGYSLNEIADLTNIPISVLDKLKKTNDMDLF